MESPASVSMVFGIARESPRTGLPDMRHLKAWIPQIGVDGGMQL